MNFENTGVALKDELDILEETQVIEFCVSDSIRLDALVSKECGITRSAAAKLIDDGVVTVSSKTAAKSLKPKASL